MRVWHQHSWSRLPLINSILKKQERVSKRALYCLLGFLALAPSAHAVAVQFSPQQMAQYQATPENERVRILIELAKTGHNDEAEGLLKNFPLQGPHAENRTLFIQGLNLEARHDLVGAARYFRSALASDPKLTLVRSELVQVLVKLDEGDSAKHHLQLLEADAPSEEQAAGIRSFIDKIDQSHPYSFSGFVSIAPTTNINNGSSHNQVYSEITGSNWDISAANQAQSGIGISAGLNAGYSKRLGNSFQGVVAANIVGSLYGDFAFNSISSSESAELRYLLDNGFVSVGGVSSQGFAPASQSFTYTSYGPRVALNYQLSQRNLLKASIVDEYRNYINSNVQNGWVLTTDLSLTHAIDSSMNFTVFGGYQKVGATLPTLSYQSYYGGLNFYKEMPAGVTLDLNGQARFSGFDANIPGQSYARADQRFTASATLTKRDLNILGFAPSLNYTYTLNKSNFAVYDYDSHAVNFNFTKDF